MKTQAIFNCFVGARGAAAGGYAVSIGRDCLVGREDLWDSGAAAGGFRFGFGERAGISTCWENMAACCLRVGFAENGGISSRRGHVCAFTYNYVKTRPEHPAPHDLSASQSEAPRSECVVIDVAKCGFQSGIGEMASISFCLESAIACGFRYSIAEMAGISSRGGHVHAFTYDYVKTRPEYPAPHDLLSSGGGNKVCFATTPPDMEASCIKKQQKGYDSRYTFSAKELDDETQYSYFGARYYDSDLSVWLSVDKQCSNAPNFSPYTYCFNNPIKLVDPDGNWPWEAKNVRDARGYARATDGDFEKWTGRDNKTWASVDVTNATDYKKSRSEANAAAVSKVFSPEGKSWGKAIGDAIRKIDEGGSADGANTGRITEQDKAVGLGIVGAMSGVGVLAELSIAGAGVISFVIPALSTANCVDDAFTNSNGESGFQQMMSSSKNKDKVGAIKFYVGIISISSGVVQPQTTLKSLYKTAGEVFDAISTNNTYDQIEKNKLKDE